MEALRDFPFAGRQIKAGEEVTATDGEARTLQALRWAKPAKHYATRVMQVEEPVRGRKPRKPRETAAPKRAYRRRDMQAET